MVRKQPEKLRDKALDSFIGSQILFLYKEVFFIGKTEFAAAGGVM